jgi:hypothetical protein
MAHRRRTLPRTQAKWIPIRLTVLSDSDVVYALLGQIFLLQLGIVIADGKSISCCKTLLIQ